MEVRNQRAHEQELLLLCDIKAGETFRKCRPGTRVAEHDSVYMRLANTPRVEPPRGRTEDSVLCTTLINGVPSWLSPTTEVLRVVGYFLIRHVE